jgi:hypothetical protein
MKTYLAMLSVVLVSGPLATANPLATSTTTEVSTTGTYTLDPTFFAIKKRQDDGDPADSTQVCCWACNGDGGPMCCCDYDPKYQHCGNNGCALLPGLPDDGGETKK